MEEPRQGEVCGRHYATGQALRVRWHDNLIRQIEPAELSSSADAFLAPPLFDLQINGYAGVDFQQDDLRLEDLLTAVRQLRLAGCACFLLTLITDDWSKLTARWRHLRELRAQSPEIQR